jgi:hypothetical protein
MSPVPVKFFGTGSGSGPLTAIQDGDGFVQRTHECGADGRLISAFRELIG